MAFSSKSLFDDQDDNSESQSPIDSEWVGMPEFSQGRTTPVQRIVVNFESHEDAALFAEMLGQKITKKTDSIWFPPKPFDKVRLRRYVHESSIPDLHRQQGEMAEPDDCEGAQEDGG